MQWRFEFTSFSSRYMVRSQPFFCCLIYPFFNILLKVLFLCTVRHFSEYLYVRHFSVDTGKDFFKPDITAKESYFPIFQWISIKWIYKLLSSFFIWKKLIIVSIYFYGYEIHNGFLICTFCLFLKILSYLLLSFYNFFF